MTSHLATAPRAPAAGFTDPVRDAQEVFRAVLQAQSHPGRRVRVPSGPAAPAPLGRAMAGVLLALADLDTPLWLQRGEEAALAYLRFHTGAPVAADPAAAAFAIVTEASTMPPLDSFRAGDADYPEVAATVLIAVAGFGQGQQVSLAGPGIERRQGFAADGLGAEFWAAWRANRGRFPLGVDALLFTDDEVVALPRSVGPEG
ncbi:phosphonate C-P lyase system protein PhnH [Oceanibacterium hippocampi]|uniref:Alpha-D-ribose 1-methylphosphonate 5-triphosphate synthase subunit PhnH n=1 Tax=Oceanibacterium hippocampi TaxID=745714 RepID=A0A1Y5TYS4_9PROT|nr:phosphonate C-P lyase system protein PhnH [Oceanibacterium hippocampi]SLN76109.1 Alpha-D-ribose 1-methylphosphonate 5-triphosphate synthase subunit PhnH [Oceanibacterium hippocampi]